jgi:hypothetical protein
MISLYGNPQLIRRGTVAASNVRLLTENVLPPESVEAGWKQCEQVPIADEF